MALKFRIILNFIFFLTFFNGSLSEILKMDDFEPNYLSRIVSKDDARLFVDFIDRYSKEYKNNLTELIHRFKIFQTNLRTIRLLNKFELGSAVYGITENTDLSDDEFKTKKLGLRLISNAESLGEKVTDFSDSIYFDNEKINAPTNFDWRSVPGVVSKVKNQGQCGSCWAFSAAQNIEGVWAVKKKETVSLSEQELVDCTTEDEGCGGGLPVDAFKTIIKLGGIESESDYPYRATQQQCHADRSKSHVHIDSYIEMPKNETFMQNYLYMNGPISIGLNANAMQFYFGGISHPPKFLCDGNNLDHGVLLVGYGVGKTRILHRTQPYWIIKNSWGSTWGEKGYYRVYRGDNTCGLANMASSSIVN